MGTSVPLTETAKPVMQNFSQLVMQDYEELEQPIQGTTKGTIPNWLDGNLFRNGPGRYSLGGTSYKHLFDGMAMVQKFKIKDGTATYNRKFIRSDMYEKNMAAKRIVVSTFGTLATPDPCKSMYQRFMTYFFPEADAGANCLVNIFPIKDALIAATETMKVQQIDPETLDTLRLHDYTDYISVHSATAHPHYDPDGTYYNIGMGVDKGPVYKVIAVPPSAAGNNAEKPLDGAKVVASIPARWKWNPGYMHSFCMSENYFILIEQPLCMNVPRIMTHKLLHVPIATCMQWHEGYPTRFLIIDRKTGEQVNPGYTYVTDKLMIFHQGNAYEEDGHLVLDVCGGDSGKYISNISVEAGNDFIETYGRRYVLPLKLDEKTKVGENLVLLEDTKATASLRDDKTVNCSYDQLSDFFFDFPMINYKFNSKKYRYLYGVVFNGMGLGEDFRMLLIKIDIATRNVLQWEEEGCFPSEVVFVATPGGEDEDDGVLLSAVMDRVNEDRSFLLVLDAKTFTELGRVEFDTTFPKDFHGCYLNPGGVHGLHKE
ncbi:carotenoid-cleaving dioxygenase, mitochondrial-like isoform X2 [Lineus longissimus]